MLTDSRDSEENMRSKYLSVHERTTEETSPFMLILHLSFGMCCVLLMDNRVIRDMRVIRVIRVIRAAHATRHATHGNKLHTHKKSSCSSVKTCALIWDDMLLLKKRHTHTHARAHTRTHTSPSDLCVFDTARSTGRPRRG